MSYAVNPAIHRIEAPPIMEAQTWIRSGLRNRTLLNLCQAVPKYPPAEELQDEVARVAKDPGVGLYTDIFGLPELRGAIAAHMAADYRGAIGADEVCVTAGCNQAFSATIMALAKAGDNVIVPVPYFFNHTMWLGMLGIEARYIPALSAISPWPRAEDAESLIDHNTRAIVLCSPNNPTGAIYPAHVIGAFHDLAAARGLALVIDETYKDFRDDPAPPHGVFTSARWQETFVHLYSFSKVYSMTGYRVGSIIAGRDFLAEIEKILDCMHICAPHISQRAALFGLSALDGWKREKIARIQDLLTALRTAFQRPDLHYELVSSGALFAYVKHPFAGETAKQVAMRLAGDHDVLCLPGSMFGPGQDDYLRIAFANAEPADMETLTGRLVESQG
ncbi:MAG: aminotransferase [Alphaproteobacteria bacterium]|nr:aminotransferase [Alphaproteobacteria bacterium]